MRFNPRTSLVLVIVLLCAAALSADPATDRQRELEAQRRYLENLRREVTNLERDVRSVESQISDRQKQLAEAPKTIKPAEAALAAAEQRQNKAKSVMPDSKKKVDDADAKVIAVVRSLKSQYDGAAQLDATETKLADARTRLDEARKTGVEKLKNDAQHKAAKQRAELAQIRVEAINEQRERGEGSSADVVDAATDLLRFQNELTALESKVLAADERYTRAKADLQEAEKTLAYLREQMSEKLKNHPEYSAADGALAKAREAWGAATRELQEASKARAEASGTVSKLKAQVKEFERDTERLKSRKQSLEAQLRAKERRAADYARSIGR